MAKTDKDNLMRIGAAAEKAGVSRQSLQYYLMIELLEPAKVTETGRRLFDEENVKSIKIIKNLNESGYTLRAIRDLFMQRKKGGKGNSDG